MGVRGGRDQRQNPFHGRRGEICRVIPWQEKPCGRTRLFLWACARTLDEFTPCTEKSQGVMFSIPQPGQRIEACPAERRRGEQHCSPGSDCMSKKLLGTQWCHERCFFARNLVSAAWACDTLSSTSKPVSIRT